jgi:hypothetical protein
LALPETKNALYGRFLFLRALVFSNNARGGLSIHAGMAETMRLSASVAAREQSVPLRLFQAS